MVVSGRVWWLGVVLAAAAGVGLALWRTPHTVQLPAITEPDGDVAPASSASQPAPHTAPPLLGTAPQVPPGLSADQWQALRTELAGRPGELRRVAAHFTYADRLQRFRAVRSSAPRAELLPLAQALDQGLDERLQQREMSAGEARLVKLALLDVLVDDDAGRRAALARWEAGIAAAQHADNAQLAPNFAREAEFQRRQAALVAAWNAQPVAQRDPRVLEQDLDALRRASFGAVANPGGTR